MVLLRKLGLVKEDPVPSTDAISAYHGALFDSMFKGGKMDGRKGKASGGKGSPTFGCRALTFMDGNGLRLGWPENFSLLSYNDLCAYLESQQPAQINDQRVALLRETMSTPVLVARAEQTMEDVACHFDTGYHTHSKTKIAQVMTSPAITLASDKTVTDAAAVMLKKKIHRLPIVNKENQVIGIVTRDDVLRGLEAMLKI